MATKPNTTEGASALSNVVRIRPGIRLTRKPSHADIQTSVLASLYRKAIEQAQGLADQPEKAFEAALQAARVGSAIPALNLRCVHGTRDIRTDYDLRLAEMELAKATADANGAAMRVWLAREAGKSATFASLPDEMVGQNHALWLAYQRATLDFARTPSPTRKAFTAKRQRIGSVWLKAEGEFYASLRSALDEDEAQLTGASRAEVA